MTGPLLVAMVCIGLALLLAIVTTVAVTGPLPDPVLWVMGGLLAAAVIALAWGIGTAGPTLTTT